jgi:hypothetical protein
MKDSSTSEAALGKNVVDSLNAVPRLTIIKLLIKNVRFSIRSARFIYAYQNGLDGRKSAWTVKKYRGHRVLPTAIMKEFDDAHPAEASLAAAPSVCQ